MEISWIALLVTAWSVVIIGLAGLIVADRRKGLPPSKRAERPVHRLVGAPAPPLREDASDLMAALRDAKRGVGPLLRDIQRLTAPARRALMRVVAPPARAAASRLGGYRRPVYPIMAGEILRRLSRGWKTAAVVCAPILVILVVHTKHDEWYALAIISYAMMLASLSGVMSTAHTIILRSLPYRGPIPSTVLAAAIGAVTAYSLQQWQPSARTIILGAAAYGAIIGIVEREIEDRERAESAAG